MVENGTAVDAADYELTADSGVLTRLRSDAPSSWAAGKIVVTYVAGYADIAALPDDIQRAAIVLVNQYRYSAARDPQLRSEQTDGAGSSSYFDGLESSGMSPEIVGLSSQHRKPSGACPNTSLPS